MSSPKPFAGGPCADVTLGADDGLIVARPYDYVVQRLAEAYDGLRDPPVFIQLPVLLRDPDTDEWMVDLGLLRTSLVSNVTPWAPKPVDAEGAGIAIGKAMQARPDLFKEIE